MPDRERERRRVPDHRSDVLKGSPYLPQCFPARPWNTDCPSKYPRLSEESVKESRDNNYITEDETPCHNSLPCTRDKNGLSCVPDDACPLHSSGKSAAD